MLGKCRSRAHTMRFDRIAGLLSEPVFYTSAFDVTQVCHFSFVNSLHSHLLSSADQSSLREKLRKKSTIMAKQALRRDELQEAFTMNCSSDNTIPINKLGIVLRSIGRAPTQAQLEALSREFDSKGVRTLTCAQVEAIINKYEFHPENPDALRDAFRIFDKDGNGLINANELRHILCNLGEKLKDEEVDEMIREADLSGDGQINFEEFVRVLEQGL